MANSPVAGSPYIIRPPDIIARTPRIISPVADLNCDRTAIAGAVAVSGTISGTIRSPRTVVSGTIPRGVVICAAGNSATDANEEKQKDRPFPCD